jgi:hypothetical protein
VKLDHALKEWAVAVEALEKGETILLLRKGGIREERGTFTVAHRKVLLYPTYEHQKPHLLKTDYADQVEPVPSGWHPSTVRIGSWAEITDIFQVSEEETVSALLPFHIWNEQLARERFGWKPRQPLTVLLLRVYRFPQAKILPFRPEYGGCRSWLDFPEPISLEDSIPAMADSNYGQQVTAIHQLIHAASR